MDAPPTPPRLVFFDGVCGMCDALVTFFVRVDRDRALRFTPLQGETARELRRAHPSIPAQLESMAFLDEGRVYLRSRAIARCFRYLPWPWRLGSALGLLPAWLVDPLYGLVARTRYRIFGKKESCRIPTAAERALFMP